MTVRATIYVPGRGTVTSPERPTPQAAYEWADGYVRPMRMPPGSTVSVPGMGRFIPVELPSGRWTLRPVGREPTRGGT